VTTQTATDSGAAPAARDGASVAHNAFYLMLGQVATTALAIVMSAALGRTLGAADFGTYFLVFSMSTFAFVFVDWGQMLLVIRDVAREPGRSGAFLGTSLALRTGFTAVVSIPVVLVAVALGYDGRTCVYALVMVWATLPMFLAQGYGLVFRGRDRMGLDATVSVTNKAFGLAFTLALLAAGAGIPGVMGAQALAGVVALAVAARLYRRRLDAARPSFSREAARHLLAEGMPIVAMTAAVAVQPYLDAIILSRLAPASSVGWYGAAKNVMGTLFAPALIVAGATYPRLSRAAKHPEEFRHALRAALRPILWLGALGSVGTWLFAGFAIDLIFGAKGFGPAGAILQVFGYAVLLMFVDTLLGHVLTATGRASGFAAWKIASVVVSTLLDLWLIPYFERTAGNGGIGVIAAFGLSEVVVFAGTLYLMPRGSVEPAIGLDVARAVGAALLTGLVVRVLPAVTPWLGIPLCVALFTGASVALGLVTRADLDLVKQLVRRKAGHGA
jgi:O-antigen/teichoic acid export membrane protein